jgi:hypothetical protein
MHAYHDRLPGFDPGNVLHDGCQECEDRATSPLNGLLHLDHHRFRQAWADMLEEKWSGGSGLARKVSVCDQQLMSALYSIAVLLERAAGMDPHATLAAIDEKSSELEAMLRRFA